MPDIKKFLKRSVFFPICIGVAVCAPIFALNMKRSADAEKTAEKSVLELWQIDNFEGGQGSRSSYLQGLADKFYKQTECYVKVTAVSSQSAVENLEGGNIPHMISYGAGICGIEGYLRGEVPYYTWCHGGYCFLALEGADFSDLSAENTVINCGIDNKPQIPALFCGVAGAVTEKPTSAYVKLINGKYKYLLGTQRDIFRLKTRGVSFTVKPVTEFNDLYQNISVTATNAKDAKRAEEFIQYLFENCNAGKLGLFKDGESIYDNELSVMENLEYDFKLTSPVSKSMNGEIISAIGNSDENKLKTLLK